MSCDGLTVNFYLIGVFMDGKTLETVVIKSDMGFKISGAAVYFSVWR
jgi:hypothetical protein